MIHRWAAERGHLIQVVLGIPSYYRLFGYEYALPAEGGRYTPIASLPRWGRSEERKFQLRDATEDDVPFITRVLKDSAQRSMVSAVFREEEVRYFTFDRTAGSAVCHKTAILCKSDEGGSGEPIGVLMYAMVIEIDEGVILRMEMSASRYWREALPSLLKELRELTAKAAEGHHDPEREIKSIRQDLQPDHPAYVFDDGALGHEPERQYGWYVRVPDVAAFLRKICRRWRHESRLRCTRGSLATLRFALTATELRSALRMAILPASNIGKAVHRENASGGYMASARFPGQTFLAVLFGMRSVAETIAAHTDANAGSKSSRHLMETLFPKRSSDLSLTLT